MTAEIYNPKSSAEIYLNECLRLREKFENPPEVILLLATQALPGNPQVSAVDIAVSTALQCYSPGVSAMKHRPEPKYQAIADSTLDAGHHTTRMHIYYTWRLESVTRSVTHDVFHAYPFYNSEQQSQRFVEAKMGNCQVPFLNEKQRSLYLHASEFANSQYFVFLDLLKPEIDARMQEMYPQVGWQVKKTSERLNSKAAKLRQEIARYILPIGQFTTYDHTLNEIQLLRLFHASRLSSFSDEARYIIAEMVRSVANLDPSIWKDLRAPADPSGKTDYNYGSIERHKKEFDKGLSGSLSRMHYLSPDTKQELAQAIRNVFGQERQAISDSEALDMVMNPSRNKLLADVYEVGMHDPATDALRQVNISFDTKLSHTADSQRQRHRRTPAATPPLTAIYDGKPDYIMPMIISDTPELSSRYEEIMENMYQDINRCLDCGMPLEYALLLLPNAHALRVVESGDLFDWLHRFKQRLCYLAQEEIFQISVEQTQKIIEAIPETEKMILAPCGIRQAAGIHPRCPEGDRWCGKAVYRMKLSEYPSGRLV